VEAEHRYREREQAEHDAFNRRNAATLALARQYALEHGHDKIRVNAVNADRIRSGLLTDDIIRVTSQARGLSEKDYMSGNLMH
jgi:NAD(P)-dependent dehydrogenase (short-subunit alcohol dehydrogenase family)